jgi:hypothetical protein
MTLHYSVLFMSPKSPEGDFELQNTEARCSNATGFLLMQRVKNNPIASSTFQ